jgi:hypothetical protein
VPNGVGGVYKLLKLIQNCSSRCQTQKSTARKVSCVHPERMTMRHGGIERTTLRLAAFRCYRGPSLALATSAIAHDALLCAAGCSRRKLHRLPVCQEGAGGRLCGPQRHLLQRSIPSAIEGSADMPASGRHQVSATTFVPPRYPPTARRRAISQVQLRYECRRRSRPRSFVRQR